MRSSGIRFRLLQAILGVAGSAAERSIDIVEIRQLEGAFSRPPAFANPVGGRDAAFAYFALTVVRAGRDITDYSDAGETLDAALLPWRLQMGHPSFQGPADATVLGTARPSISTPTQGCKR
jgi:hypothetical protein